MNRSFRSYVGLLVAAFALAGFAAQPAMAQDKAKAEKGKAVQKVFIEDARVRVTETTFKPGDTGPNVVRGFRVSRVLSGGTLQRTWADGKTEKREVKTGQVLVAGPDDKAYFQKNIGKTNVVFYTVNIKGAK